MIDPLWLDSLPTALPLTHVSLCEHDVLITGSVCGVCERVIGVSSGKLHRHSIYPGERCIGSGVTVFYSEILGGKH